ncbi:hypothetical protein CCP1ISM_60027 [Azospirillaceae bacterium]
MKIKEFIKKYWTYFLFAILLVLFIVALMKNVSAEESISSTSFVIKISNNTIQIISNEYSGNNKIFNFSIIETNSTNSSYVQYSEFNYSFLFVKNVSVDMSLVRQYTDCLNVSFSTALGYVTNLSQCQSDIQIRNSDLNNKDSEIAKLNKEAKDTENQKYLFGAGGAGLAVFIVFLLQGKIGKKVRSKGDEFGKTQAA